MPAKKYVKNIYRVGIKIRDECGGGGRKGVVQVEVSEVGHDSWA